jgi:hypothetical protein
VIVIDDDESESDDPLSFTSTPASRNKKRTKSILDADLDLSFRSVFPGSDDDELESEVYTGVGMRSKTAGFLKGGGAGGRAVWAGPGTVTGADDSTNDSPRQRKGNGHRR